MSDPSPATPPDNARIETLRDEVATLRARLADLESRPAGMARRTLLDKLGAIGGLLALVIALGTGTVTFWDDVVLRGEKQRVAEEETLRGWLNELTSINAQIQQAQASGNPQAAAALMSSFGPTKDRLMRNVSNIYRERPEIFNPRDLFLLAAEALAFGDKESATKLIDDLLSRHGEDVQIRVEALQTKGRINGMAGVGQNADAARGFYREAVDLTASLPDGIAEPMRLQLLNEWLQFESTTTGDCDEAHRVLAQAFELMKSQTLPQLLIEQFRDIIFTTLESAPARCKLPRG